MPLAECGHMIARWRMAGPSPRGCVGQGGASRIGPAGGEGDPLPVLRGRAYCEADEEQQQALCEVRNIGVQI